MATDTNHIVKQGLLKRYSTSENRWVEKYYILFRSSESNASRLDYYDSKVAYQTQPTVRKTFFVEEIVKVERLPLSDTDVKQRYGTDVKHMFKIDKYRSGDKPEILSAESDKEAAKWIKSIHELVVHARTRSLESRITIAPQLNEDIYSPHYGDAVTFKVEIEDSAASNLCDLNGTYRMMFTANHVTLFDDRNNESVLTWEYCNIRRHGFGSERFTLEGGRKAGRAAGLFMFKNCKGAAISAALGEKMRQYQQQRESATKNNPSAEYTYVCKPTSPAQQLPARSGNISQQAAVKGVPVTPPVMASAPPLPGSPPMQGPKPKPKVAAKNLNLNLNDGASANNSSKLNGVTPRASDGSVSSSNSSTPVSPFNNGGAYVGCNTTSSSPTNSATGSVGRLNATTDDGGYVNRQFSPGQSTSSLTDVKDHATARKLPSDTSGAGQGPKMSEVLENLRRMKSSSIEGSSRSGPTPVAAASASDVYEHIELSRAGNLRLANSDIFLRSAGAPTADVSDPSHLYGPIQSPAGGAVGKKAHIVSGNDSEYAEIGFLS